MANTETKATEEKKFRTISYIEENYKDGVLFEAWSQEWGLKVYTWYSMDKLKFSFIDKGAKGKGKSFDICVNTIKNFAFDIETLKHEILHDIKTPYDFLTILKQEKDAGEKYPKRYKFITGSSGEKYVGICNSMKGGLCINGKSVINGKPVYANIPCTYYDIYRIIQAYDETYAARRDELKEIRKKGIQNREDRIRENKERIEEDPEITTSSEQVAPGPAIEPEKAPIPTEETSKKTKQTNAAAKKKTPSLHVRTLSDIMEMNNGDYTFEAAKDDDTAIEVRIPKEVAAALDEKNKMFQKFINKVNSYGADFSFTGKKKKTELGIEYIFEAFC